jgi:flagellar biosynthetic protein FliR
MTMVLFPIVRNNIPQFPGDSISLLILIIRELLIGLSLSLLSQVIFAAVEFCGQMIAAQMGLSMASIFDPEMGQVTVISNFQDLLAMLLFMTMGVHHIFIRAIVESYSLVPVGAWHMSEGLIHFLIVTVSGLFVLAIKLAAPVMVSLLASAVLLGIMARSFPQMNIFMISFPLNISIGLLVLGFSLQAFSKTLADAFGGISSQITILFKLMA